MKLVDDGIALSELKEMAERGFGTLVKAVVDVASGVMAIDAELHADEEAFLLERGSDQHDLWGINLYPDVEGVDWLEFDSVINLRPASGNRSRGVDDRATRDRIREIVTRLVRR
ncbi:MAG TPA: DUF5674 family protein [Thermoanaerobaculaceae bacterium]|nr:DUF5674 family protein [Thermoanaerobaculaceae bacterium]